MAKIQRLPEQLANQIAAGEVIERPSSAAKELTENALDAGARRIDVLVGEGGRQLRVTDDGEGMTPEDAPLAFERFTTSKIREVADLFKLATMGFRGEALASIAAVARVELTTRRTGSDAGTRVRIVGGADVEISPFGCPEGTTIAVDELFFNTPARLKFMKSPSTEVGHVVETLTALALAHPRVAFTCKANNRVALDTTGARDLAEAAALVLGEELGPKLLKVRAESGTGLVDGLVAPPELIRGDRAKQWLFINGRPIRHPALARAVDEAFSGHIPDSRHPIYVVSLTIDPERVDFNVHPTKKEVRLADAAHHYGLIREAVGRALRQAPSVRQYYAMRGLGAEQPVEPPVARPDTISPGLAHQGFPQVSAPRPVARAQVQLTAAQALELYRPAVDAASPEAPSAPAPEMKSPLHGVAAEAAEGREAFPWDDLRLLGQIHDTYLVLEHPDGLYIVDQHNSHERYLYEQLGPSAGASQALLLPRRLDLPPDAALALAQHRESLAGLGFAVAEAAGEPSGAAWELSAVPASLPAEEGEKTLLAILEDLAAGGDAPLKDLTDRSRVTVACHSAVKAGDRLTPEAMRRLLDQWRTCEQPFTCPHGRPTAILIPTAELHRRCMRGMQTR